MSRQNEKKIYIIDGKPTMLVCEECERVCNIEDAVCPVCKGELSYFIKEDQDEEVRQRFGTQDSNNEWDRTEQFQGDNPEA